MPLPARMGDRIWNTIVAIAATFSAFSIPTRLVFPKTPRFAYVDWVTTAVFLADLAVRIHRFRVARAGTEKSGRNMSESRPVLGLAIDALAALPIAFLPVASPVRLLRLIKLVRVAQLMTRLRARWLGDSSVLRLTFFAFWLTLVTHWLACGWYALGGSDVADARLGYIDALYWCVMTLTTVGYGDRIAHTPEQQIYAMGVMIVGVGVYGYTIGNITSLLTKRDPARQHYLENIERLTAFMQHRNIPHHLRRRVLDYSEYLWDKRLSYDESALLSTLPPGIQLEISLYLKRDILERVPLFKGAGEKFIRQIALQMQPMVVTPGDFVIHAGELGHEMYFVSRGTLEVLSPDGGIVYNTLKDGDYFGEISLLMAQRRTASVRAIDYCDLYSLDRNTFERVLEHYPEIASQIQAIARERSAANEQQEREAGGA